MKPVFYTPTSEENKGQLSDHELLDILYSRIENKRVRLELFNKGDDYAQVTFAIADGYQFDAMVYYPVPRHL